VGKVSGAKMAFHYVAPNVLKFMSNSRKKKGGEEE
jgi:hypothetical protein